MSLKNVSILSFHLVEDDSTKWKDDLAEHRILS